MRKPSEHVKTISNSNNNNNNNKFDITNPYAKALQNTSTIEA